MLLSVQNNLDSLPQTLYSYLSSAHIAGGTTVNVKNINSFTDQYAIQIGKTGQEMSEIKIISGVPAGTSLNTSGTLTYDHPLDTPVFQIHYDKIIFKRSTTGTAGSASPLATVSITPDSLYTEYNDTSGAVSYAYKTQYYNSVSSDVSSESDWFLASGPSFYSLQKLRDRARKALYNSTYITDDTVIDDWINEWLEEMTNVAIKANRGYALGTAQYAFGTAGYGTITEAGFKQANKFEITYDGITYVTSAEIPLNQYSEGDVFSTIYPAHSWEGETVFRTLPFGQAGTVRLSFGKLNTPMQDDSDELPQSLRGYTTGCIEYVLYRAYDNDNKDQQADKHFNRYLAKKGDFQNEITPRDQTGAHLINMVEPLTGSDNILTDSDYYF